MTAAERQQSYDVLHDAWREQVYYVGCAEQKRRLDTGQPLLTPLELLAFVESTLKE